MLGPLTRENLADYLTALADDELDAAQALAVWTYLGSSPDRDAAIQQLVEHHRLSAAAKLMSASAAPTDLRERISSLVASTPMSDETVRESGAPIRRASNVKRTLSYALAAAAGLAIGVVITIRLAGPSPVAQIIPGSDLVNVSRTHAECSRLPEAWHNATFEATDAQLATSVQASLSSPTAAPDLAAADFRFVGAGPCRGAGVKTVHLLYRSTRASSVAAVSIFVQADQGQFPKLEFKRVYRVSSPTAPFPILTWRDGGVIYILVADNDKIESAILQILHPTPADQILTVASR